MNDRASVEAMRRAGRGRSYLPQERQTPPPTFPPPPPEFHAIEQALTNQRRDVIEPVRREEIRLLNEIDTLKRKRRLLEQDIYRLTKRKERLEKWVSSRPAINAKVRGRIVARCKQRCAYCHKPGDETRGPDGRPWHIDHIVPFSEGGPTVPSNLTLACATCNISKGNRFLLLQVVSG